jgi:hypothetical protein
MRRSLHLFLVFLVWAFALTARTARAQTTTTSGPSVTAINNGVPVRLEPNLSTSADNQGQNPHPGSVAVNYINYEDCAANLVLQFQLAIASIDTSYNLDVWASTSGDCTQIANRQSATAVCWPVITPEIATTNPFTVNVRVQDIVSQETDTSHTVTYSPASSDVCQLQTATGAQNITLYFFFESAGNSTGTAQQYPMIVDTRAGDVQGAISAGVGDTVLIISIPSTTDTDTQGYDIFCDPPPGQEGTSETVGVDAPSNNGQCVAQVPDTGTITDTGSSDVSVDTAIDDTGIADTAVAPPVLDDAGGNKCGVPLNDAQIPAPGGCSTSTVLVPGGGGANLASYVDDAGQTVFYDAGESVAEEEGGVAISGGNQSLAFQYGQPYNGKYLCGTGGASSTTVNVLGLKDGYYYNIAVAAVDAAGNVGPLSNVVCGEPVPVADFWHLYYEAGGKAGGGFCSTDGAGLPAGTGGLGILMVASMVGMIRKRRTRS